MHAVKEKKNACHRLILRSSVKLSNIQGRKPAKGPPPCLKQGERYLTQYSNGIYAPHAIIHHKNSL